MRFSTSTLMLLLTLLTGSVSSYADSTGKIAGTVRDKQSRDPLLGANIIVKGTTQGAAADAQGRYYIIGVPPGIYELGVSYIGYHTITVRDVRIQVDLTTRIDVELEPTFIEAPTVEVVAEQKLVQKDITATRRTVTRETLLQTAGLESAIDIFKLQGGTVIGNVPQVLQLADGTQLQVRDNSLKDIFVRGGRGGEILYIVDGVPVTHPIYGGRSVLELNVVDVSQMELLTGAFNAEYGQAQSGVVNITTRTGGEMFTGGVEYKTDNFEAFGDSYETHYASFYLGGPLPLPGLKSRSTMTYFISGNGNITNTPYDNDRQRGQVSFLGLSFREKQDNAGSVNAKVNWNISSSVRTALSYHGSWKSWSLFEWMWLYYPNNMQEYSRDTHNLNLQINHVLSQSTYYNLNFGYLSVDYNASLNGKRPIDFWTIRADSAGQVDSIYSNIRAPQTDPLTGFFDSQGYENIWRDDFTRTFVFRGDITSQIHPDHLVKAGVELRLNDISYIDIQDGGAKLSSYGEYVFRGGQPFTSPPGPFKEFGQNRWVFDVKPLIGGAYIQDKFEKEIIIINAGVRADWLLPGSTVMQEEWKKQWQNATGLEPSWRNFRYKLSPRFGISFPISDRTVVFFSYGHFTQLPELQYFYRDPYSGGFTGNPHLDYERTILYEFGFTNQFARDWAIDIKSYTKDISGQVQTTQLRAALGVPVELYDNKGYARARGLEFELTKRYADFTSGKLTYTVQWASGYSSSAFDDYIRSINDFPYPIRERRLNWDVRHQVILQATVASPKNKRINLFGVKLPDDWNLTLLSRFSSGQPYTPGTLDPVEAQVKENASTGPFTTTTDIKFIKSFTVSGFKLSLYGEVYNFFDQKNVQMEYGFNPWTGKPFKYGDTVAPTNQLYDWYTMFRFMDPRQFSTGRTTKIGLRVDW